MDDDAGASICPSFLPLRLYKNMHPADDSYRLTSGLSLIVAYI